MNSPDEEGLHKIQVKRGGRPVTQEELEAAVHGGPLPDQYLFVLGHGINTGRTKSNWTHRTANLVTAWDLPIQVNSEHYPAGPFPYWNNYVKNPRLARGMADITLDSIADISRSGPPKVVLWGHSNGCDIMTMAAQHLIDVGVSLHGLLLTGSAVHSDVKKNGILEMVESGMLRKAIAYSSEDDDVIRPLQWMPGAYGSMSTLGFTRGKQRGVIDKKKRPAKFGRHIVTGPAFGEGDRKVHSTLCPNHKQIMTRWWPGYHHSEWHELDKFEFTLRTALKDLEVVS